MHKTIFAHLHRLTAAGLTALVFLLTALAASPNLHEKLHTDADHAEHECAIVLYANGVTTTVAITVQPAPAADWVSENFAPGIFAYADASQQLHPPVCGPPRS